MERGPKIFFGATAAVATIIGIISTVSTAKDDQSKCDGAIHEWNTALIDKELGIAQLRLAAAQGQAPNKASITRAASNDNKERGEMKRTCSSVRYLNALETQAAEEQIDRMNSF